jgi:membrane peptidoglycan carboxypeptidase
MFVAVLGVIGVIITTFAVYQSYAHDLQNPQDAINSDFIGPGIAYDRNGQKLGDYIDEQDGLRDPIPLEEISPYVIAATIATEDASFYENPGVNFNGLARAAWENLTPFEGGFFGGRGGSSITQQLVKNVYFQEALQGGETTPDKVNRKIKETVIAIELKRDYSDNQILAWYLNEICYGRRACGIEAASEQFYGKKASELTLPEATYLVGLPQAPGYYAANPEPALERQQEVYDLLVRHIDEVNKIPSPLDPSQPYSRLSEGLRVLRPGATLRLLPPGPGRGDVHGRPLSRSRRHSLRSSGDAGRTAHHQQPGPRTQRDRPTNHRRADLRQRRSD